MPRKAVRGKGHGGARPNSGRKPKLVDVIDPSTVDRKTRQDVLSFRERYDLMPLDYCMRIVNGLDTRTGLPLNDAEYKKQQSRRDNMAQHCTAFLHSRLSSVELTGKDGAPLLNAMDYSKLTDEELMLFERLASKAMVTVQPDAANTLELTALPAPAEPQA